ncbi:hypothetical protein BJ165DRAFT_1509407 [Panaeolus papilionaceus]|nr:hypothetical protein BJ165DRAFT_1509407 [Panaeolus papilionaceus]
MSHIRAKTKERLEITRSAHKQERGVSPTDRTIWQSLRNKDISRKVRAFLWTAMHNRQRTGNFWKNIPECSERAYCQKCNKIESIEHILLECHNSGQETIWGLAQKLMETKVAQWNKPSLGHILGAGIKTKTPKTNKGIDRLNLIITTESTHLIWKLRCEWKIARGEDPNKLHTTREITNRWYTAVNTRLKLDCLYTNRKKFHNKALKTEIVLETWKGTLQNEDNLPEVWVREGVLVGIRRLPPESHTEVRNGISPSGLTLID